MLRSPRCCSITKICEAKDKIHLSRIFEPERHGSPGFNPWRFDHQFFLEVEMVNNTTKNLSDNCIAPKNKGFKQQLPVWNGRLCCKSRVGFRKHLHRLCQISWVLWRIHWIVSCMNGARWMIHWWLGPCGWLGPCFRGICAKGGTTTQ